MALPALPPKLPKWTAHVGGTVAAGIGLWAFFALPARCSSAGPRLCPAFALQSPWILRGERAVAVLLGIVVLIVVLCRLGFQGRLPDRIGRDAAEWYPEAPAESREGLQKLQEWVGDCAHSIDDLTDLTERTERSLADLQEEVMAIRRDDRIPRDDREDAGDA